MPVSRLQFDPMFMDRKALFNEVAAHVMPGAAQNYIDALIAENPALEQAYLAEQMPGYIDSIAINACPLISMALPFTGAATAEPQAVRDAYDEIRRSNASHYAQQKKTGASLSNADKTQNAHVELHAAVTISLIDRILARLPS